MKLCPLCEKEIVNTKQSHIIPLWALKKENRKSSVEIETLRLARVSKLVKESLIVCADCETRSDKWDGDAAILFKQPEEKVKKIDGIDLLYLEGSNLKAKKFVLWTIFKAVNSKKFLELKNTINEDKQKYIQDSINGKIEMLDPCFTSYIKFDIGMYDKLDDCITYPMIDEEFESTVIKFSIGPFIFVQVFADKENKELKVIASMNQKSADEGLIYLYKTDHLSEQIHSSVKETEISIKLKEKLKI